MAKSKEIIYAIILMLFLPLLLVLWCLAFVATLFAEAIVDGYATERRWNHGFVDD